MVKELSFLQTALTDDAFFNQTGLERVGVVGPEPGLMLGWSEGSGASGQRWDCCYADRLALDVVHLYKKNQKEEGSAGALPVASPMPKSVSSLEKRWTT